jgi:hypothetical protein
MDTPAIPGKVGEEEWRIAIHVAKIANGTDAIVVMLWNWLGLILPKYMSRLLMSPPKIAKGFGKGITMLVVSAANELNIVLIL